MKRFPSSTVPACLLALSLCLPAHAVIRMGAVGDSLTDEYLKANDMAAVDVAAMSWVQILAQTRPAHLDFGAYKPSPSDNWGGSRDTGYEYNWAKSGAVAADQTRMNVTGFGILPITVFGSEYASTQANGIVTQVSAGQLDTVFVGVGANDFWFRTNWVDSGGNATPIDLATLDLPQLVTDVTNGILYAVDRQLNAADVQVLVAKVHIREEGQTDARSLALVAAADQVNTNLLTAVTTRQALGKSIAMVDLWEWGGDASDPHHRNTDGSLAVGDIVIQATAASIDPADGDVAVAGTPGASTTLCTSTGFCALPKHATHFTADDGLHPNTLVQALLANEVIEALNTEFGYSIPTLTDVEMEALVPPVDTDLDGTPNKTDTDDDNDGVPDTNDNCPLAVGAGTDQTDTDSDGAGNLCDADDDNDGVADIQDAFPLDAAEWLDSDGDGTGNNADTDSDNDGVADESDNCPTAFGLPATQTDTDSDGDGDVCDSDDDNDGTPDAQDAFPLNAAETTDTDGDGIGNVADSDDDNDGVADGSDNCPLSPGLGNDQTDTDADGAGNLCDSDDDNDGVLDVGDQFPLNAAVYLDFDNDGAADRWNTNCDATCQANSGIVLDNCPNDTNTGQLDTDGDSQGDACDADDDNDRLLDSVETALGTDTANAASGPELLTVISFENGVPAGWTKPASANATWLTTTSAASHLSKSLRAGAIGHNQKAQIQANLLIYANSLSFDLKTSSEPNLDIFRVYLDGLGQLARAGENNWQTHTLTVSTGLHTVRFEYGKNGSISSGTDTAWIDRVTYVDATDTDGDGQINVVDTDDDNDGTPDNIDPLPLQGNFNLDGPYRGSVIRDSSHLQ